MKKKFPFSLFLFLSLLGLTSFVAGQENEDFKVVGVDVQKVFQHFHKTLQTETQINEERIRIQKADQVLEDGVFKAQRALNAERKKALGLELTEQGMKKDADLLAKFNKLSEERKVQYDASNNQLNQKMTQSMQGILSEIQRFIVAHAEKRGYFMVLETSGASTNQTSPVIGGKGITDITDEIIAELNKVSNEGEGSE